MNYLHNKDLYIEIVVSKAQGKLTKNAKLMLELLAKKTIKKMRYWSTDDKMDCYQGGLLDMFANWYNFNEEKSDGNAFAYFTEIFKRVHGTNWATIIVSVVSMLVLFTVKQFINKKIVYFFSLVIVCVMSEANSLYYKKSF